MADPTPPPAPAPSGQPDRRALLAAYQSVVKSEQDRRIADAQPEPVQSSGWGFWITTTVLIVGLATLLITQPAWMFNRPVQEPAAVVDASLRVRMFVEIERIERFRRDSARLPATLAEAGIPGDGLTYEPYDGGYTLTGASGPRALAYSSGTPPETFLGDSYRLLRERGRP
jgi:hypothetical protein